MSQEPKDKDPHWKVLRREPVYSSDWINLYKDWVQLPDGSVIPGHHVIEYVKEAVAVVPVNEAGQVMLVDHYRFITGKRGWEVPAGGVDKGETWEAAARREMLEESGCTGGELAFMSQYHPSNGSSNQLFALYFARGVAQTAPIHDTNEIIAARWFDIAEIRELIDQNRIPDGLTLTSLLMAFYKGLL
ncbi:MAG: hydrolase [Chloroflexi bacterium]|jgi:8-oxo-dGTP pyrophosphatase MutT (NUDIX family)|nr:hydrolase [Chloroflexota bacterium]